MPMICHECGALYPAAGICPRCFPTAGTKPAMEPISGIGEQPKTLGDLLVEELHRTDRTPKSHKEA